MAKHKHVHKVIDEVVGSLEVNEDNQLVIRIFDNEGGIVEEVDVATFLQGLIGNEISIKAEE